MVVDGDLLRAWLRQAATDFQAGQVMDDQVTESHRRYWLQQACEKGIKALGLILWTGPPSDQGAFRTHFLHKHSPLKNLEQQPGLPKSLPRLLRQLRTELASLDGDGLLRRLDATTPTIDPTEVSYRYPFRDSSGAYVAPSDWKASDWDGYQGNFEGVVAAVGRFMRNIANRARRERGPK